jgi:hypothetical protein
MHRDAVEKDENDIRIVYRKPIGDETDPREIEADGWLLLGGVVTYFAQKFL